MIQHNQTSVFMAQSAGPRESFFVFPYYTKQWMGQDQPAELQRRALVEQHVRMIQQKEFVGKPIGKW